MAKFRKKPVVIDAVQWVNDGGASLRQIMDMGCRPTFAADGGAGLVIETREGDMRAEPFDWIIKGVKGEFYPCKPDVFEATYDSVEF